MISRLNASHAIQKSSIRYIRRRRAYRSFSSRENGKKHSRQDATPPTSEDVGFRTWWRRPGTPLIAFGWTLVGILLVDRLLQYRQAREVQETIGILEGEGTTSRSDLFAQWSDRPALFQCVIRQTSQLGGSNMLHHVKEGDVVDVLEEGVGPERIFNLCRNEKSIGWYPMRYMEKLPANR